MTMTSCYHCGATVDIAAPWSITVDGERRGLCCPGCEAVAHAIVDAGLDSYYRFRSALPERPSTSQAQQDSWRVFDDPGLQARFVKTEDNGIQRATLAVDGITCAACAWLIEHHLNALDGIVSSAVNLSQHRVQIRWDPTALALSRLLAEMAAIGYPSQPYEPDQAQIRLQQESRMMVRRLIVAAVGMMQVLMFSIPHYVATPGDLSADFERLFAWLALALTTPVVLFSAQPFFRGAWRDVRSRVLGMDVPVALAIGGAYLASIWAVVSDGGDMYFDSVSMFTFFLLFGRYIEAQARAHHGRSGNALSGALPAAAVRLDGDDQEQVVPADQLRPGDRIRVRPGQQVPADGIVTSGIASLDESMLSGESLPVTRRQGDDVCAGSLAVDSPLELEVTRVGEATRVASIVDLTDRAFASRPRIARLAERIAHRFVINLLLVTAAVALAWTFIDPARSLWVTLSVLVVTCPCALALATPTALTAAHGRLRRAGVLVTRADALETLAGLDRLVFDKTGTLTRGDIHLAETRLAAATRHTAGELTAVAAALEAASEHPIARAFATHRDTSVSAQDIRNHPGRGIGGRCQGALWRLGRADFALGEDAALDAPGTGLWLLLTRDGHPMAWFRLDDRVRDDAAATLAALTARGLAVEMLSGDSQANAATMASQLNLTTWRGNASPEDKLAHLQAAQARGECVAMVGDGINDIPVLAGADLAITLAGASDLTRTRADIILLGDNLQRIVEAIEVAELTRRIIRQNLSWSVLYNVIALPLAALGFVPPWAAALGMSASSLLVVGNALRLTRWRASAAAQAPLTSPISTSP
ncbi:heavy metal translocating P-type ATPase [Halomonas sp. V046]|uniref:heavy metal translocating P-type ATPase n=1 Tax=Halomonas sp. V046 TaxID=3459611 RepID=UPI0040451731